MAEFHPQPSTLTPAIAFPDWLAALERENLDKPFHGDDVKLRFAIRLAVENVRRRTGGPFGAAIFELETDRLVAVGVNSVVPAGQSWAHAEMTAFSHAQQRLGTYSLKGCMLVTSCEPCAMCFGATPWSGVEKMVYGAPGAFAREVGFDEGDKLPDWESSLEKRGVQVVGPLLLEEAREPFTLYKEMTGVIY